MQREAGGEIEEGSLACERCGAAYPIVRGVPRFVNEEAYAGSFGKQWNWFRTVQIDSLNGGDASQRTLAATSGWTAADYAGRRVLDAGAGAGRFADVVARLGGEVVAVDLSQAVEAAWQNIGRRPGVHVVQADIFALPLRENSFDLAYSIGVLHHTPDFFAAFANVANMVRPGGGLAVYAYPDYTVGRRFSDLYRRVATRLPAGLMWLLASAAVPLYYLHRAPLLNRILPWLAPISMHPNWRWRWLDTFDWYTPKYQWKLSYPQVYQAFERHGFSDVRLFDEPIRMRGTKRVCGG